MRPLLIRPVSSLKGKVAFSGDKSIAHRAIIISAITPARTRIQNFPTNKDCLYTLSAFRKLGIRIKQEPSGEGQGSSVVTVFGQGLFGLKKPSGPVFVGESGTTLRLILGILAGQDFAVKLSTAKSLAQRPMLRVTYPLRLMGARIEAVRVAKQGKGQEEYPPIQIKGGDLRSIKYSIPIASAQVKSCLMLAGLYARGVTRIIEPVKTRDHTERMLKLFKADIKVNENTVVIKKNKELRSPREIYIPGDISSASFFIVAAAILPDSEVLIKKVSLNPFRIGIIKVLKRMGAFINTQYSILNTQYFEPMADLIVRSSLLKGTRVRKQEIPSLIDELPVLMVAACFAQGETLLEGVGELRVKETDRVRSMLWNLKRMGAEIKIVRSGDSENIVIKGVGKLKGARVRSFGDHRTAMSMIVAGLGAEGQTLIDDSACIDKSFPFFIELLNNLIDIPLKFR